MGTILANAIISKAQVILQDTTGIRWPSDELLGWLNDGQREIVIYKPNAYIKNISHQLKPGTKQDLPPDGVQLMDLVRNMGATGTQPGRAIRLTMREVLDAQDPNWHLGTPSPVAVHYTYSVNDPKTFYVYPPQPTTGMTRVEMVYGASPTNIAANAAITVDDVYQNVLLDYMLYRAYSKDSEYTADQGRADKHQNAYLATLSGKVKVEQVSDPNLAAPANPNVKPNTR